ncbi:MAG: peptidoglycan DD-metalloendopeptidase family protein [Actinomycetota bacterium]
MRRAVYARVIGSLLLALVAFASAVTVDAQPRSQDDIQRRLEEIARLRAELAEREQDLQGNIAEAGEVREALTEELSELQAIVDEVQGRVDVAAGTLAQIQAKVDKKDAAITYAQKQLERRIDALGARAVHMYKHGASSWFVLMVKIRGVGDLLSRLTYVGQVSKDDNANIAEIDRTKKLILRDRDELAELRDDAAAQMAVVAEERNRAATIRNDVSARRNAVSGKLEASYAELGDVQAQREQYDRETAELQSESAAIAAFLRGRGDGPAQVSPKGMTWPTSGPITSGFGWRTHPIFGTRRFHAGIDIGAPTGNTIVAAGAGEVVFAGSKNGYGNATIIDHGGGIATLYAHQSSIAVGVGAKVGIGQAIGAVGCTGYCTGPHLHFEVRVNGEPVDPMGWLP